jgi:hypothetical protein
LITYCDFWVKQGCVGPVVDEGIVELTLLEEKSVASVVGITEDELEGSMNDVLGITSKDVATSEELEAADEVLDTMSDETLAAMSELATLGTLEIVLETMPTEELEIGSGVLNATSEELRVGSGMLVVTSRELRVGSRLIDSTSEDMVLG